MTDTMTRAWERVSDFLPHARLIAWDGCHKIYLAMDDTEAAFFTEREDYDTATGDPDDLLATLTEWWDQSCSLRFINAVSHNAENPNAGFTDLIPQFADHEDDDGEED